MDVKVVEQENWSRMVEVLVPQDELQPEFEKGYRKYQKKVKIQGFRPGRAPLAIIKQMYGPRIEIEVIEDIIPRIITDAWKQENLKIVSPPKVDDLDYQPGSDLRITFTVDVEPEIQIEKIEGFRFDRKVYEVEDEDVEQALQTLREEHAVWENIDEPATEENFVLLDLQELDESGLPIVGRKFENELFALKNQQGEVTELGRQVIGARAGETRVVVLTPSPRPGSDEPVQPVKFEATIKEVRRKNLPELDDEFAKDLGDYDSLEELKKALREQIQRRVQQDLDRELERQIIDEIIKNNPFEVPKSMVDTYLDNFVQQIKQSAQDQNIDEQALRNDYRPVAIWNIKWRLIRDHLVEAHGLTVSEDEIRQRVEKEAEARKEDKKRLWNRIKNNKDAMERIRHDLLEEKVLSFLKEKQKMKEKKVRRKDLEKKRIITE